MKKILLSGAAFAVIGLAATAAQAADPIKLTLGGYADEWVGYATNQDSSSVSGGGAAKLSQWDQKTDAEIKVDGSDKLDNGIEVDVEAAFNPSHTPSQDVGSTVTYAGANGQNGAAKRVFAGIQGAFGDIQLGQMENVESVAHNDAPDAGSLGISDGFWNAWVPAPAVHNDIWIQTGFQTDQPSDKVAYTTPNVDGFQAAIDATPDIANGNYGHYSMPPGASNVAAVSAAALAAGSPDGIPGVASGPAYHSVITYGGTFSSLTVAADVGYMFQNFAAVSAYNGGVSLTLDGFTLAGSYIMRNTGGGLTNQVVGQKGNSWDAGLMYANGPWGLSGSYFHGASRDFAAPLAGVTSGVGNDTDDLYLAGLGYTLGPGIKLTEDLFYLDWKTPRYAGESTASYDGDQNKGWAAVSGLALSF